MAGYGDGVWEESEDVELVKSFVRAFIERPYEMYSMFWKRVKEFLEQHYGNYNRRKWTHLAFRFERIKRDIIGYKKIVEIVNEHYPQSSRKFKVSSYLVS